jgi:ABC-2 type transport system permease protein
MELFRSILAMMELEFIKIKHDRTELYTRAVQPILWLVVFGPIMGSIRAIPTGGIPYTSYITPGVLIQSTTFISIFYGLTIVWERESGILKKLIATPASRYAIVIGRSMASGIRAVFQIIIIIPIALLIGVHFIPNLLYFLSSIIIIFFASQGFAALSIAVASIMKTRERFMGMGQVLTMPLFFASNALYPVKMMPLTMQYISMFNPLSYQVDALRGLLISGDTSRIFVDIFAIAIFNLITTTLASLNFKRIVE